RDCTSGISNKLQGAQYSFQLAELVNMIYKRVLSRVYYTSASVIWVTSLSAHVFSDFTIWRRKISKVAHLIVDFRCKQGIRQLLQILDDFTRVSHNAIRKEGDEQQLKSKLIDGQTSLTNSFPPKLAASLFVENAVNLDMFVDKANNKILKRYCIIILLLIIPQFANYDKQLVLECNINVDSLYFEDVTFVALLPIFRVQILLQDPCLPLLSSVAPGVRLGSHKPTISIHRTSGLGSTPLLTISLVVEFL
ncbi:hypothetical protein HK096_002898, partial [Nowakowskiella sp. JEL0078]